MRIAQLIFGIVAMMLSVGCSNESVNTPEPKAPAYGYLEFGDEDIPVEFVRTSYADEWLMVMLSPITDSANLTTNAIIGLRSELLGKECDVERLYCIDDYMVVYEDPQCYYAPFRPLQSGTIFMYMDDKGVSIMLDVVLFDGTPLSYQYDNIALQE